MRDGIKTGSFSIVNRSKGDVKITARSSLSPREKDLLSVGGLLPFAKEFHSHLQKRV